MPFKRLLGFALALSILGVAQAPRALASKVTVGSAPAAKQISGADFSQAEQAETAVVPREPVARPALTPSSQEPVKYDALPEKDRKPHTPDELFGLVAEV